MPPAPADKVYIDYKNVRSRAHNLSGIPVEGARIYGVPRGGVHVVPFILHFRGDCFLAEKPEEADFFVDDIIDSGHTRDHYEETYGKPFYALVNKRGSDSQLAGKWVEFFWERLNKEDGPQDNIRRILEYIGEDPSREGLLETPDRVVRSYSELFSGYKQNPEDYIKTFTETKCDEMIVCKDVDFYSTCEHHFQPFFGKAHIAYIPDGRVIGLSKLARLLEVYCRRLQIQERLTEQVTAALETHLKPKGAACVIEATHFCMVCRGVQKPNAKLCTSSLTGVFRSKAEARAELFQILRG